LPPEIRNRETWLTTFHVTRSTEASFIVSGSNRIKSFDKSATFYRKRYYIASMSNVVLSALITIVAGWSSTTFWTNVESKNAILGSVGKLLFL